MNPISEVIQLGVDAGAGLGHVRIKQDALGDSYSTGSAQFGVVLDYQKDRWVLGAELHHQLTGGFEQISTAYGGQGG